MQPRQRRRLPCIDTSRYYRQMAMLTDPGAFPVLRRVSVKFGWYLEHWSESEKDAVSEELKEINFPRLVESEAVEYNFSVSEHA